MNLTDRLQVGFSTLIVAMFLFSLTGSLVAFALPLLGIVYLVLGGKKK